MNILVTGGTGYIGSHTVVLLLEAGHTVTVADNLSNSSRVVLDRIKDITSYTATFCEIDLCNQEKTDEVFASNKFDAVIHFAGLKAVGESVNNPTQYYRNNIDSSISILAAMQKYNVNKLIFSSSATVYGNPGTTVYDESLPTGRGISSPYGQTKFMIEQIIKDVCVANPKFEASLLRYFNPIGAHPSGKIGEDPLGIPNNLMPFITQVAGGEREVLSIFGNDYPTPDGTCLRDYIHVMDLAKGHLIALERLQVGVDIYNLGSGRPTSVLEIIKAFKEVTGKEISYKFAPRRSGDLPEFYANPSKAKKQLGWETQFTIKDMCRDTWHWQQQNPHGYRKA